MTVSKNTRSFRRVSQQLIERHYRECQQCNWREDKGRRYTIPIVIRMTSHASRKPIETATGSD